MTWRALLMMAWTAVVLLGPHGAEAITLGLDPATQGAAVGSSVEVAVVISGLTAGGAPSLGSFDLRIEFDPAILGSPAAVFGDPVLGDQLDLAAFGPLTVVDTTVPGEISIAEVSLDALDDLNGLQADSFTLATLTFLAIGAGVSPLDLVLNVPLADAEGVALTGVEVAGGSVTVTKTGQVAEPQTALLMTCAVGAFGVVTLIRTTRRRARSASATA